MNTAMGEDLLACFTALAADADARRRVLTGAGERAFCAGGDLKERNGMTDEAWRAQHVIFEQAAMRVLRCPVPVIAAVEGFALAGGCELAILSDFIVAGRDRGLRRAGDDARDLPGHRRHPAAAAHRRRAAGQGADLHRAGG